MDRKALVYKGIWPNATCCDQTLRILPNGEWAVFFMTGGSSEPEPTNFVAVSRSTNGGEVWGPMEVVLKREDRGCTLSEVIVHKGVISIYVTMHAGYFDEWKNYIIRSTDNGHTWSEPEVLAELPRRGFVRNLYVTTWGDWILPYQYYEPRTGDFDPSPLKDDTHREMWIGSMTSHDEGKTWSKSNLIRGRHWAENNVVELRDGRLVMLTRADGTGCLWRSESLDRGVTWCEAVRTEIPNPGTKFRLFRLRDGRIAMIHNPNSMTSHPNSKRQAMCHRNPLALWITSDDMATWGFQRIITDFPGHLAYPDGVLSEDEQWIHFVFDYNRHDVIYFGARLP